MPKPSRSLTLQRVMFDPLSYIHPRRVSLPPHLTERPAARAAVNDLLLATFGLATDCDEHELDAKARHCVRHWQRFPQIAYLIGCHALRADLAWQGKLLQLPSWARSFATIDLPSEAATKRGAISHGELLGAGYARLHSWRSSLPAALAQRLRLLFPPQVDELERHPSISPLILTLAYQHAQRHPHTPPADAA